MLNDFIPVNVDYHHPSKGCQLVKHLSRGRQRSNVNGVMYNTGVTDFYCVTHQVEVCHCGWTWGVHYGIKKVGMFDVIVKK